jgi:hypothetical protein
MGGINSKEPRSFLFFIMKNKKRYPGFLCIACLCAISVLAQDHAKDASSARDLLAAAHQASGLDQSAPYEVFASVVINPGAPNEKKGRIMIYRDKDRFRYDLQVEEYHEMKLVLGSKLYLARSSPYPVPGLSRLQELDRAWDRLSEDGDAKLGDVSQKKVQHVPAACFDVKGEQKHRLCFDPARKVLLESLDQRMAIEFSDYTSLGQMLFPRKITALLELPTLERPVLTVENIEVSKANFEPAAFAIPDHAIEFDTCDNQQPAKPVKTPNPQFSNTEQRKNIGTPTINVYAIVGKDGNLENVMVLSSDADLRNTALETLKKWRYTPAMCGSTPVASELETQVSLFQGEGGEGEGRGRR